MNVTRQGRSFEVVDDARTASWDFWQSHFASGRWEPETLRMVDQYADPRRDFLDVGAWVGPVAMWASSGYRSVHTYEPDAAAFESLRQNTRDMPNVWHHRRAITHAGGDVALYRSGEWGDSMSSIVRGGSHFVDVDSVTLKYASEFLDLALAKIDIEGGESDLTAEDLGALDCPIVLSLHWGWLGEAERARVHCALSSFQVETLDATDRDFPLVILR